MRARLVISINDYRPRVIEGHSLHARGISPLTACSDQPVIFVLWRLAVGRPRLPDNKSAHR